jgi:hypothetical protein
MLGLPAVTFAQSLTMSVTPASGPPGHTVTLDGQGFSAYTGSPVEIDISIDFGNGNWDLLVAGAANPVPDANGNFSVGVTIPANAPPGDLLVISSITEPEGEAFFTVTKPPASAPRAPSNLTVKAASPYSIRLNWRDNSSNETGFEIDNGVASRRVAANRTTYTWGQLLPATYMCFRVRAYNRAGHSAWDPGVSPWYVCTSTPPGTVKATVLPYNNYAGYAAYPSAGYVHKVQAIWSVPSISCPPRGVPRAAAWVGMWGGTASINNQTAWLPQIGTVSHCDKGKALYVAFWEMATGLRGQGNAPQILSSVPVHANDTIVASVTFVGPTSFPNGYQRRKFELTINNTTDHKAAKLTVLSGGVQLASIISQAGAVIEDEPPCSVWDLPDCNAPIKQWLGHGLAEFSPPVHFSNVLVSAQSGAKLPWKYYEYVMRDGKGGQLLGADSTLGLSKGGMYYTITWKTQG